MSEYFLADVKAEERARQRQPVHGERSAQPQRQEMKVNLLGDFLFPVTEPQGCDPYNSVQGKAIRDAWNNRRERR